MTRSLAWLLRDLPVVVCARLRAGRVFYPPAPPRTRPCRAASPSTPDPGLGVAVTGSDGAAVTRSPDPARPGRGHRLSPDAPLAVRRCTSWSAYPRDLCSPSSRHPHPLVGAARTCGCVRPSSPPRGSHRPALSDLPAPLRHLALLPVPLAATPLIAPLLRAPQSSYLYSYIVIAACNQLSLSLPLSSSFLLPFHTAVPAGEMTPRLFLAAFRCALLTQSPPPAHRNTPVQSPFAPKALRTRTSHPSSLSANAIASTLRHTKRQQLMTARGAPNDPLCRCAHTYVASIVRRRAGASAHTPRAGRLRNWQAERRQGRVPGRGVAAGRGYVGR